MDSANLQAGYQQVEITTRHPRTRGGHAGRAGAKGRVGLRRRPEAWPPRSATALDQAPTVTPEEPHPYHLCTIGYHLCTIGPARIDPLQQLGIVPDHALPYWWGGVRFLTSTGASLDGDDGEVREEPRRWSERDRSGGGPARRMLTAALEAEVEAYVAAHLLDRDENGRVPPEPQRGPLQDVVDASRYRHRQLRSWHDRKANQPPRAVQTGTGLPDPSRPTTGAYAAHLPITP